MVSVYPVREPTPPMPPEPEECDVQTPPRPDDGDLVFAGYRSYQRPPEPLPAPRTSAWRLVRAALTGVLVRVAWRRRLIALGLSRTLRVKAKWVQGTHTKAMRLIVLPSASTRSLFYLSTFGKAWHLLTRSVERDRKSLVVEARFLTTREVQDV